MALLVFFVVVPVTTTLAGIWLAQYMRGRLKSPQFRMQAALGYGLFGAFVIVVGALGANWAMAGAGALLILIAFGIARRGWFDGQPGSTA